MSSKVHNIKTTQSDVATAKYECCELTEECTAAYIARVRERHEGRWICGLCAEVIKDEFSKRDDITTTDEALQRHISFCEQFRLSTTAPPREDLISAVMQSLNKKIGRFKINGGRPLEVSRFFGVRFEKFRNRSFAVAAKSGGEVALAGVLFEPFEEVKRDAFVVPISPQASLARQNFQDECELGINEQLNMEYSASYVYHAMYAYFDRDNVTLKGLAKFFKESSEEEREHAEKLMEYQTNFLGDVTNNVVKSMYFQLRH